VPLLALVLVLVVLPILHLHGAAKRAIAAVGASARWKVNCQLGECRPIKERAGGLDQHSSGVILVVVAGDRRVHINPEVLQASMSDVLAIPGRL
jgi:hypothetical protein